MSFISKRKPIMHILSELSTSDENKVIKNKENSYHIHIKIYLFVVFIFTLLILMFFFVELCIWIGIKRNGRRNRVKSLSNWLSISNRLILIACLHIFHISLSQKKILSVFNCFVISSKMQKRISFLLYKVIVFIESIST